MSFVDELAVVGTNVGEISTILYAPELVRPAAPATLKGRDIRMKDVYFSYGEEEVLHGIDLNIQAGRVTALVGPSGSGKSTLAKLIAGFGMWRKDLSL
ncbi:MAG: ATP-binding cassette domain-containing protein [Blautia sp.]